MLHIFVVVYSQLPPTSTMTKCAAVPHTQQQRKSLFLSVSRVSEILIMTTQEPEQFLCFDVIAVSLIPEYNSLTFMLMDT